MLLRSLIITSCLVGSSGFQSLGQDLLPAAAAPTPPAAPATVNENYFGGTLPAEVQGHTVTFYRDQAVNDGLNVALEKYRQAEADSDARDQAKDEIQKALGEQYDAYLESQEKQLDEMEEKLGKLREQLKQRAAAKQKMVDLKFEMVLAQLEGLGWPDSGDTWFGTNVRGRYLAPLGGQTNLLINDSVPAIGTYPPSREPGVRNTRSTTTPRNRGAGR